MLSRWQRRDAARFPQAAHVQVRLSPDHWAGRRNEWEGVLVGPFTPGFVADQSIASELADIGVILLLLAVGLHFSPRDLLAVRDVALPGALAEIALL